MNDIKVKENIIEYFNKINYKFRYDYFMLSSMGNILEIVFSNSETSKFLIEFKTFLMKKSKTITCDIISDTLVKIKYKNIKQIRETKIKEIFYE